MAGTSSPPSPALPLLLRPPPLGRASPLGHLPAPPEPRADADWLARWDRHAGPCLLSAPVCMYVCMYYNHGRSTVGVAITAQSPDQV